MNKKSQIIGHGLTWIYKFVILIIVVGGTAIIVARHYSKQLDVRNLEANAIAQKVLDCIIEDGRMKEEWNSSLRKCFHYAETYLEIKIENKKNEIIELGDKDLAILCKAIEEGTKIKKYPSCHHSNYLFFNGGLTKVELFIAIGKFKWNL